MQFVICTSPIIHFVSRQTFCITFLLGITVVPRETEDNVCSKCLGGNWRCITGAGKWLMDSGPVCEVYPSLWPWKRRERYQKGREGVLLHHLLLWKKNSKLHLEYKTFISFITLASPMFEKKKLTFSYVSRTRFLSSVLSRLSPWPSTVYRYSMHRRHCLIHFFQIHSYHRITHVRK